MQQKKIGLTSYNLLRFSKLKVMYLFLVSKRFTDSQHTQKNSHFWLSQLGHMGHNELMSFPTLNIVKLKMKKKKTLGLNDIVFWMYSLIVLIKKIVRDT